METCFSMLYLLVVLQIDNLWKMFNFLIPCKSPQLAPSQCGAGPSLEQESVAGLRLGGQVRGTPEPDNLQSDSSYNLTI